MPAFRLRHVSALAAAVVAIALVQLAPVAGAATRSHAAAAAQNRLGQSLLSEINKVRRSHGLQPLTTSAALRTAADAHARSMGRLGFFDHTSRDGTTFDRRIARFYPRAGSRPWFVGENQLWYSPTIDARMAVGMWLASPAHRRNLLDASWRQIGIGAIRVAAAPGVFEGRDVTILVTDFGVRS
jgi:uncharacterized protein YkwD